MSKTKKTPSKTEPQQDKANGLKKRELTDEEQTRLGAYQERANQTRPLKFKLSGDKRQTVSLALVDPDDPLASVKMAEAFGTADHDALGLLFEQMVQTFAGVTVPNDVRDDGLDPKQTVNAANRAAALLAGIKPQDELEGMLAVQMIAVHNAAMYTVKLAMLKGQTFEGKRSNMNYATKVMSLFTSQMEALKKCRTGGQQKVAVEHVHVNEGGQAIVGAVNVGGGSNRRTEERPHAK